MTNLAIFDYGAGNLHSLVKAISTEGTRISVKPDLRAAMRADLLILPGVGGFGAAVEAMNGAQADLASALASGLPCLGICLGMQLLFDVSEESEGRGIGLIPGRVERLCTSKVPHMGWNQIEWCAGSEALETRELETAYFANSYICQPEDDAPVIAWTTHETTKFASVVRQANTIGVQFHPEKSSSAGRDFVNALVGELLGCR